MLSQVQKPALVIRADGNTEIGLGHIIRTLALADMVRDDFRVSYLLKNAPSQVEALIADKGFPFQQLQRTSQVEVAEVLEKTQDVSLLVLDGYSFRTGYQQALVDAGKQVIFIDDLHSWHIPAHVVINHSAGVSQEEYDAAPYTDLCLGPRYALLRAPFLLAAQSERRISGIRSVFIAMGGGDPANNTLKALEAALACDFVKEINVVAGAVNPNLEKLREIAQETEKPEVKLHNNLSDKEMVALMLANDLAIVPGSSIGVEVCAVKMGLLTGITYDNQQALHDGLIDSGCGLSIGNFNHASTEEIAGAIAYLNDPKVLAGQLKSQSDFIDGRSGERIRRKLLLLEKSLHLWQRHPEEGDAMLYYNWANDPAVRNNAINKSKIELEDHRKWFSKRLSDPDTFMLLFGVDDQPYGQVRFNIEDGDAVIDYSVDDSLRGQGWGYILLRKAIWQMVAERQDVRTITGKVKSSNVASMKVFEKLNFSMAGTEKTEGDSFAVYSLNSKDAHRYR